MWEKMNKEEKNNKFQRLRENEKHVTIENNNTAEYTYDNWNHKLMQRMVIIVTGLICAVIVIMCLSSMASTDWVRSKGLWRTSAQVHVYTYAHLARLSTKPHFTDPSLQPESDKVVSCYYNLPSNSNSNQLMPKNIHSHLCTHINVAFARIVNKEITLDEDQYTSLKDIVRLKLINPKLKILLSIGGSGNDSGFSDMVVDHASRKVFIKSIKRILRNYTLDGVDLDWEFPALHKSRTGDRERQHFSQLLREIRMEYIREKRNYLLTIAAPAPETIVNISYDIDQVNQYVDYVNIMTYDYHFYTKYTPFTGFNSPLYARSSEQMYLATLNINSTVHMYLEKGLDRNKVVVGIPTYGHTFTLVNADNPRVGSPASGYGSLGGSGFINYPDVCNLLNNFKDVVVKEDNEAKVPYMYRNKEWISYDTPQSVKEKAKFIKEHNLRGAMIYSLNADDYAGVCNNNSDLGQNTEFPLLESVKNALIYNNSDVLESNKIEN